MDNVFNRFCERELYEGLSVDDVRMYVVKGGRVLATVIGFVGRKHPVELLRAVARRIIESVFLNEGGRAVEKSVLKGRFFLFFSVVALTENFVSAGVGGPCVQVGVKTRGYLVPKELPIKLVQAGLRGAEHSCVEDLRKRKLGLRLSVDSRRLFEHGGYLEVFKTLGNKDTNPAAKLGIFYGENKPFGHTLEFVNLRVRVVVLYFVSKRVAVVIEFVTRDGSRLVRRNLYDYVLSTSGPPDIVRVVFGVAVEASLRWHNVSA